MSHEVIGEDPGHRRTLLRMALMYTPLTVATAAVTAVSLVSLLDGAVGAVIPLVILGAVTAALGYQAVMALRDLRSEPTFTRGEIQRAWGKGGLLWFFRSHYLMVNRQVFVLPPEIWVQLAEGDVVECHHWPHTKTTIRVLLLKGDDQQTTSDEPLLPILPD